MVNNLNFKKKKSSFCIRLNSYVDDSCSLTSVIPPSNYVCHRFCNEKSEIMMMIDYVHCVVAHQMVYLGGQD